MDIVSLKGEVHDELINRIINFVFAIVVVIHDPVEFSLGIGDNERSCDGEVEFCWREAGVLLNFLNKMGIT